jgi:signal peptidase I
MPEQNAGVAAAKPAPARGAKAPAAAETKDSFREIVETIVFVVVLVLLLKSFVAEAFVIPTGSMAETLYGYQKMVECDECHHQFPVNCSSEVEENPPVPVVSCQCPNCELVIDLRDHKVACSSGDRVLVAKFLYDTGLRRPSRYDVVVFKFPEGPQYKQVAMNYIKRLIGFELETIGILEGDLYVAEGIDYSGAAPEDKLPERRRMHKNDPQAVKLLQNGSDIFKILRKPPAVTLAESRSVYFNNEQAKDLIDQHFPPRWAPERDEGAGSGDYSTIFREKRRLAEKDPAWVSAGPYGFKHPARGQQLDWLRYRHLLAANDQGRPRRRGEAVDVDHVKAELIRDAMGYNSGRPDRGVGVLGDKWVGDLLLEANVTVEQAEGEVVFELSKSSERFRARWNLQTGLCTLERHQQDGQVVEVGKADTAVKKPGTYKLRFANVDRRLTVWVDSALPFHDGVDYDAPRAGGIPIHGSNEKNDLEPASIGVQGGGVSVQDLKLARDTYYTNPDGEGGMTLYVQPGHYFCMGDNSPQSSDGRNWGPQDPMRRDSLGGLVPERLMLGRAEWIYWPIKSRFGAIK